MTAKRVAILLIAVGALAFTGCRSDRGAARGELTRKGLAYDADAFVERAREGDAESVKLFVVAGMSPDVKDRNGWTPLVRALAADRHDCAEVLLAAGAAVDARTDNGYTPLTAAAMAGDEEVVKTLLGKVGSSRVDLQACKLEYSIVSPK